MWYQSTDQWLADEPVFYLKTEVFCSFGPAAEEQEASGSFWFADDLVLSSICAIVLHVVVGELQC